MVDDNMRAFVLSCFIVSVANAGPLDETRYCGAPQRDVSGVIVRSSAVITAFRKHHPCPSTALSTGPCPGWSINHIIPLACGGCDAVANLVYAPNSIKTCSDPHCIDRYERKISASTPPQPDTATCVNKIVP